ncbi:hypothetical protein HQ346_24550 [Rhodococcus sp. BP-252]|uniref:Uncharacterized protein n=1 Tax=Rhodococcoides kyotonense TaxID=398843 RepID=A0A177YKM9_9NOCA|nr:hypothetical protein [Rhodococcus sp. BP-320]MBY6419678.1 hypothetical protein [Rhodococcus sp. BP-321]MBY6424655.1 hypothetical protein [Rhodococcus sp. BP-324]MBY6429652.1 hypothetical protein [Rhodococcus sp. BP-323]MBY6434626.1 hypothetical protein [Rhodococcus sp. BP-322]MBY6443467.1 hypothetical protein [Rhodococcus sp. BP-319]MBY6448267.1 hypothetical protein [Rhodococcus sp. BP-318]MBY6453180.1 hypothetical protein [Rhodococcus sp. BP-315]MBY6457939.1 hypothetical protein [Rhodoc
MVVRKLSTAAILAVLGAAGLFNGVSLVTDSSGRSLGLRVDMLPSWHTWDYRYSGLFVLVFLGMLPLLCATALLVDITGASTAAGLIGALAIGWVLWQIVVLDLWVPRAHLALIVAGAALVLLSGISLRRRRSAQETFK